ncbi:formate/nitrite transporter family protein [Phenylobacterium sp.]|jgi:formate/nitrite transporter FocA (FNT family)|uniref:formate/nitrite transporter family protein n=1 Tax=Phenylobacterium sp. TaxID=1871053 RepID=UPI002F419422
MAEHARQSKHLDCAEKAKAEQNAPLRPLVIHEIVRAEGETELRRPASALLWSGLAAGLSMGFSFVAQALLQTSFSGVAGRDAIAAAGYAVGFAIVILGRQQLFTESTLTAMLPALHDRKLATGMATLRLWAIVLAANLVGTWLFAAMLAVGHPLPPETSAALNQLAGDPLAHPFWNTLLRALLAGWLIALMVWLLPSGGSAKIVIIALLTWLVAFAKLNHIIAGSTEGAYGVLTGQATLAAYLGSFLLPTFIGNTLGGVGLVALLNHAPVSADGDIE